jgi:endonuclease YncB( thermonuclease family)
MKIPVTTAMLLAALACTAATIEGKVVNVADGDSITIVDSIYTQHKIRLSGIDAPEKSQPFGTRSKQSLSDMVFSKTVIVDTDKRDRYGRNVGKVLVDGIDANLEQVRRGMAWHYKAYAKVQPATDQQAYANAEIDAKTARRGLWVDENPMAPWDFRHKK